MKFIDKFTNDTYTAREALERLIAVDPYSGGELEQLRAGFDNLKHLVLTVLSSEVKSADQLNVIAGCEQFKSAKGLRIIIAGSRSVKRTKSSVAAVQRAIDSTGWEPSVILSGCAEGADRVGEIWAKQNNVEVHEYPADWERYGKRAGMLRNVEMSNNADALIALWDGESPGTKNMISVAKKRNLLTHIVYM